MRCFEKKKQTASVNQRKQVQYYFLIMRLHTNRFKMRAMPRFKLSTSADSRSLSLSVPKSLPRYNTEGNTGTTSIFSVGTDPRKNSHHTLEKEEQQQYRKFRQHQLRNESRYNKLPTKRQDVRLSQHKKQKIYIAQSSEKYETPHLSTETKQLKLKSLMKNISHINSIFDTIHSTRFHKKTIDAVRRYILQQQSDLNEIELLLPLKREREAVKQMIFYERILIILLVEAHINRRYKQHENQLQQLFRQLLSFYSLLYQQLSENTQMNDLASLSISEPLSQLKRHHSFSSSSLTSLRDSCSKRIAHVANQFGKIGKFIQYELSTLKEMSTNLLYYNLLEFYAGRLMGTDWSGWGIEFLETCPSPYIHHSSERKYTLLLDLDQTLVHYRMASPTKGEFLIRPFLFQFLKKVEPYFQIGVFTCAMQDYANLILTHLPSINIKLYRQHAIKMNGELVKDLSRVGRDMSRTILVDNLQKNFRLHKQNGIHVRTWVGDVNDRILQKLGVQLCKLAKDSPEDIRLSCHNRSFL